MKKKPNVILYTILMFLVFVFIVEGIIYGFGGPIMYQAISNFPQGSLVVTEAVLSGLVLIVLLLFKNSYVFTQKSESLVTGLFYGLFYIIGSVLFMLLFGVGSGGFGSGLALLNLLTGCLLVGICEEFLCRGWLLNEFLERFGDSKKGVWYSIIVSGLIFGLMHFGNMLSGQALVQTVTQVLNASVIGIVFGVIYYKTKNIWSVIILHALWDFSLFLGNVAPVTESVEMISSFSVIGIVFTVLLMLAQLISIIPFVKDIDKKPNSVLIIICSIISIVLYLIFMIISSLFSSEIGKTYKYDDITIKNYSVIRDNYDKYFIEHVSNMEKYSIKLESNKENNLVLTNLNSKKKLEIECDNLYDYTIVEYEDYYILAYIDYKDTSNVYLYYNYIDKKDLSNDDSYLGVIKMNMKKYLLPEYGELLVVDNGKDKYLSMYNIDYGYFLLTGKEEMSVLNKK